MMEAHAIGGLRGYGGMETRGSLCSSNVAQTLRPKDQACAARAANTSKSQNHTEGLFESTDQPASQCGPEGASVFVRMCKCV